jgi:hypothetical protein
MVSSKVTPLTSAVPEDAEAWMRQAYALLPHVKVTDLLHVFGFEAVAADGAVGAAQVAGFPGEGQGSRRRRTRTLGTAGRWWC